jgi:uncharacterized protein YecE (DUF72 family)
LGAGKSNINTVDVLNPDRIAVELRGKEWVNPKEANFEVKNKQRVKTIVQKNKEAVKIKKLVKEIEGK